MGNVLSFLLQVKWGTTPLEGSRHVLLSADSTPSSILPAANASSPSTSQCILLLFPLLLGRLDHPSGLTALPAPLR